jgi:hypothetical protein
MDPLNEAEGLEGFIINESPQFPKMSTGFEGFIYSEKNLFPKMATGLEGFLVSGESPRAKLPTGFQGFLVEYRDNEKFIKVVTSRNKPLSFCEVTVNQTVPFIATADENGIIFGIFDISGIIPIKVRSGKIFYEYTIDASNQPLITTLTFPLDFTD